MEQVNNDYSDAIKFSDWPTETELKTPVDWKLDKRDEKQVETNIKGLEAEQQYYKDKLNDTSKDKSTTQK